MPDEEDDDINDGDKYDTGTGDGSFADRAGNEAGKYAGRETEKAIARKAAQGTTNAAAKAATTGATGAATKAGTAAAAKGIGGALGTTLGGPLGAAIGAAVANLTAKIVSGLIKNWPYIAMIPIGGLLIIMIILFAMWHKIFGGSTFKTDTNLTSLSTPALAMKATEDPAKREEILNGFIAAINKQKTEIDDKKQKINNAMPDEVIGSDQKKKMQDLFTDYNTKFTDYMKLIIEKKDAKYDFKKEPLTEEEFKKRNELNTKLDVKYKELTDVTDKIIIESNKTDLVADKTANDKGFYNLLELGEINSKALLSPVSKNSYWGKAFTVSFARQIYKNYDDGMIWIGDLSYPNGTFNGDYGNVDRRSIGTVVALSGSQIRASDKANYNQEKAKEIIQKLWALGARRVWVPDSDLTKDTYKDILGNSVNCEQMIGAANDYWEVEVYN